MVGGRSVGRCVGRALTVGGRSPQIGQRQRAQELHPPSTHSHSRAHSQTRARARPLPRTYTRERTRTLFTLTGDTLARAHKHTHSAHASVALAEKSGKATTICRSTIARHLRTTNRSLSSFYVFQFHLHCRTYTCTLHRALARSLTQTTSDKRQNRDCSYQRTDAGAL